MAITIEEIENDNGVLIGKINDDTTSVDSSNANNEETPKNDEGDEGVNGASDDNGNDVNEEKPLNDEDKQEAKKESKPKWSHQEQVNHSFSKLKQKHKAEVEGLKKEIENLKKQLENKVVKSDYEDEDAYLDAKLEEKMAKRELAKKEQELDNKTSNGVLEYYTERARVLYPTKIEQDAYTKAYNKGISEGTIDIVMKDQIIREFINESEYGPKLIEHFCMKPDVASTLSEMGTARKSVELVALETRLKNYLERLSKKSNDVPNASQNQGSSKDNLKVKAPVIGKVANKGANKINEDRFQSDDDLWEFMRSC